MAGGHLGQRLRPAEQVHRLLGAAVHRVVHLHLLDAVVVVRLHLGEHFFDRAGVRVAPRLVEVDRWPLVREHVDGVLRRGIHLLAGRTFELDLVEALLLHREVGGERAVGFLRKGQRVLLVQDDAPAGRCHRRCDLQEYVRAFDGGHVATRIDRARLEPGVGGEAVLHRELVDGRQFHHVHLEGRGTDAVGLNVVVRRFLDVEKHALEAAGIGAGNEGYAFELPLGIGANHERGLTIGEAQQLCLHVLIGAARDPGVARCHVNLVRAGRFGAAVDDQQRGHPAPQEGRAEHDEQGGRGGDAAKRVELPPDVRPLDGDAVFQRTALFDGLLDQPLDERRRGTAIRASFGRDRLDGAQDGRLQSRIFFLEIERHLTIRDASAQRLDEADHHQPREHDHGDEAERDDGGRGEPQCLETGGREHEREQRAGHHDDDATQRELQAPAIPDATNDSDKLLATIGATRFVIHRGASCHSSLRIHPATEGSLSFHKLGQVGSEDPTPRTRRAGRV